MSKKYSGRIHDPNHTRDEYDLYFNDELIEDGLTNYAANADIVQGSLNRTTGEDITASTRIRSQNFIPIHSGRYKFTNAQNYPFVLYCYNSTKVYSQSDSITSFTPSGTIFEIPENISYIRFAIAKPDNSDITPSEVSDIMIKEV